MRKAYTVMKVHDGGFNTQKRRKVLVEVLCKHTPDKIGETTPKTEVLDLEYTANGPDHFVASICRRGGGVISHNEAAEISKEVKKFVKKE